MDHFVRPCARLKIFSFKQRHAQLLIRKLGSFIRLSASDIAHNCIVYAVIFGYHRVIVAPQVLDSNKISL